MQGHDHDTPVGVTELRMAALGRPVLETDGFQGLDDLLPGDLGKSGAQAGMRIPIGVTNGCSK
jgi:hypothetical protein